MKVYLVRHGKAARGVEDLDPGLDDTGRAQAAAAAERLSGLGAQRLVVSPLRRTRETADPIATALGLRPEIRTEVAEVFDPSLPTDERKQMLGPLLGGSWSEQGETLKSWRARVIQTLLGLDSVTVVVSHFVAISAAIGEAIDDDRVAPGPLPNASITEMEIGSATITLVRTHVDHLGDDLITMSHTALAGAKTQRT